MTFILKTEFKIGICGSIIISSKKSLSTIEINHNITLLVSNKGHRQQRMILLNHFFYSIALWFFNASPILYIASSLTMNFYHSEIRFKHSPLIHNSFIKINSMSSEANSLVVLVDKIDENIRDRLILKEPNTKINGLKPHNKAIIVFLGPTYRSIKGITSYSYLQRVFLKLLRSWKYLNFWNLKYLR